MHRGHSLSVLDITKWYGETSGGVRTYLDEKRRYVRDRPDLRHILVVPGERDEVTDDANTRQYRIRGPRIPTQRQYRFLLAPRTLRTIIERERPDIIEVGSPIFVPWITQFACRDHRVPLIGFYHTALGQALTPVFGPFTNCVAGHYLRQLDRLFARTFVASDASETDLKLAGATRVTRVSLGVDLETFHPSRRVRRVATRALLGLPVDTPIVTYLGRIAPEKGLDVALAAWKIVEAQTSAALVLMGDGPRRDELRSRAAGMRVHWLPFDAERGRVASLLAATDVYLSPGPGETFGLSAVEAMACGTPLVAADRGGVVEHVAKSGGGLLFETGNARSLANRLSNALNGEPPHAGARGREYVERNHGWVSAFDQIFAAYRGVLRP